MQIEKVEAYRMNDELYSTEKEAVEERLGLKLKDSFSHLPYGDSVTSVVAHIITSQDARESIVEAIREYEEAIADIKKR